MQNYNNFKEFAEANKEKIFRYWVYKKPGSEPYYKDTMSTSEFVTTSANYGIIKYVITLPDNDILIGLQATDVDYELVDYYKLSEIKICLIEKDQDVEENDNLLFYDEDLDEDY